MLSTVTLGDLGDLRAGFNAVVSGAAGGRRRGWLTWIFYRYPPAVGPRGHGRARPATRAAAGLMAAANLAAAADPGPHHRRGWDSSLLRDAPGREGERRGCF